MGCGDAKRNVENEMMIMQLERANIQMERQKNLKLLEEIEGKKRKIITIPDYIDPGFSKSQKDLIKKNYSTPELMKGGVDVTENKKRFIKKNYKRKRNSKKITTNKNF